MIYTLKNGYNVATEGTVIIEGEGHFVTGGFVACERTLNHRAWNIPKKEKECLRCKLMRPERNRQLELW